jgi:hypothetical protein
MNPEMARFYARAARLPMESLLEVWEAATPSEKNALLPMLLTKKKSYFRKSVVDMTPADRENDAVLRKLSAMFPDELHF